MKKLLMAGVVAMIAASAPIQAHALPSYDYRGGCSFVTLNDTTPGGQLGGQNVWNGVVEVDVRAVNNDAGPDPDGDGPLVGTPATPAAVSISVDCELVVNGASQGTVLHADAHVGATANAGQIQFTAESGSIVDLCDNVTVGGEFIHRCFTSTETPVCPDPVCGPGGVLEQVLDALADATAGTDPLVCSVLIPLAPVINTVDPNTLYVDDGTDVGHDCDIYLFNERAIDFVPYDDAPTRTP